MDKKPDAVTKTDETEIEIGWEYELSKGKWVQYDKATSKKFDSETNNQLLEFEMDDSKLSIDFTTMKQKNLTTGFIRSIRCVVISNNGRYAWEYLDTNRRWRSFDSNLILSLEKAFKNGSAGCEVVLKEEIVRIDFENKIMQNKDGSLQYKVRREFSSAAEPQSAKPTPSADRIRSLRKREARNSGHTSSGVCEESVTQTSVVSKKKKKTTSIQAAEDSLVVKSEVEETEKKTEIRKVLVKGLAAVDPECLDKVHVAHVYVEGGDIYDALLNQTNTQNNNNKYYIIQLLEDDVRKNYSVWLRWGRVGYKGQCDLVPCGTDLEKAKQLFCKKFTDKTHNAWCDRKKFRKTPGKYDYLPGDYKKVETEKKQEIRAATEESKLEIDVQKLITLMCDIRIMEENVMELEYDSSKTPLGKLTEKQIKSGYSLLKKIESFIKKMDYGRSFVEAVNDYYTKIPHAFGMKQPPLIKTLEQLKTEVVLLEMLSNIEVGIRTINQGAEVSTLHPIDRQYMNMNCDLAVIKADDPRYKLVEKYLHNTHGPTHMHYSMKIRKLFAISRHGESEKFMRHLGNRKLLWHGSRLSNWYSILSQGLRIAPPEAPSTGCMFGKGIYFADMSSKSANYLFPQQGKPGIITLAEVALGKCRFLTDANYDADKISDGKHSTVGLGQMGPDPTMDETLEDGCVVPCGTAVELEDNKKKKCSLAYNEYIVYNTDQVLIRYVVLLDFNFFI